MQSVMTPEEILAAWKKKADKRATAIFASLPTDGPSISGTLKEEAVDVITRIAWFSSDSPNKEDVLRENYDVIEKYASDLVDRTVAEDWERMQTISKSRA